MIAILLCICILTHADDRYFGLPIGTIKDEENGFNAEVYVSDEHTISLVNLNYSREGTSCLSIMIGPAADQDAKGRIGPGILLPYGKMDFSWGELRQRRDVSMKNIGIEEMIHALEIFNSLNTATVLPEDASYEVIEYVDNEEEIEEKEENLPEQALLLMTPTINKKEILATSLLTPTTIKQIVIPTTKPVIVFKKKHPQKSAWLKLPKDFPTPFPLQTSQILPETTMQTTQETTVEFLEPMFTEIESTTANFEARLDLSPYLIPKVQSGHTVLLLTNGAKLNDYKWLGLWNDCEKKSYPHLWLMNVDPPHEEDISPLVSLNGYEISGHVRILNCNTILIPKLRFKPDPLKLKTFFYVGTIETNKREKKTKAKIIGYDLEEPLEEFDGDDIMIRLPKGVRTFDIDFISIFNDDSRQTLAKTLVPSTLVPPCND